MISGDAVRIPDKPSRVRLAQCGEGFRLPLLCCRYQGVFAHCRLRQPRQPLMAKAFTSCITGVGRFEMVRRAALPPLLRQLMAFSGSERTMASFDLTVKVLNPITHQVEEIFSQAISQSSPRCPRVASGSATKLAASAFCRMGASRISRRLKAFPLVASGNLRRTCKVECGSRLCTGWRGLKVPTGTSLDHMDTTRKSITTVFLSIAEEQCGPTPESG